MIGKTGVGTSGSKSFNKYVYKQCPNFNMLDAIICNRSKIKGLGDVDGVNYNEYSSNNGATKTPKEKTETFVMSDGKFKFKIGVKTKTKNTLECNFSFVDLDNKEEPLESGNKEDGKEVIDLLMSDEKTGNNASKNHRSITMKPKDLEKT